jgi:hypothetical protein
MNRVCGEPFAALASDRANGESLPMPDRQTADAVVLVRPAAFGFHPEAAASNAFAAHSMDPDLRAQAMREADGLARRLDEAGVQVLVLDDRPNPGKPDAVFPNNWVSFHADGTMVLYPMATERRRLERETVEISRLLAEHGFEVRRTVDLSAHEDQHHFLEGTGSLILDRPNRRAFASRSVRTHPEVVAAFDAALGCRTLLFDAADHQGRPIYHTNVLLSLGTEWAILCAEAVAAGDRAALATDIRDSGRTLIEVGFEQMRGFSCNILELRSRAGDPVIAMSQAALAALLPEQRRTLERFATLADARVPTIEAVGGGSVRCMIAEVHLPRGTG